MTKQHLAKLCVLLISTVVAIVALIAIHARSDTIATSSTPDDGVRFAPRPPDNYPLIPLRSDAPKSFERTFKAAEVQDLKITATMMRENDRSKPINVSLTFKNGRDEDVVINHVYKESDFFLYLVDEDNNRVPMTKPGSEWISASLYEHISNMPVTVHAGDSIKRDFDLRSFFEITHDGVYKLKIIKTVNGTASYPFANRELEMQINWLVFNVGNRPPGNK